MSVPAATDELVPFNYGETAVRVVMIDGEPALQARVQELEAELFASRDD